MKILLLNTASSTIINFRKDLMIHLKNEGYEVVVVTMDKDYSDEISKLNIRHYVVDSSNRSINIFSNWNYRKEISKIVKIENPDVVFSFQAKPNTLGILGARNVKKKFAMVEGKGDVFTSKKLKFRIIRLLLISLYKKAFKLVDKVFFLNPDDHSYFVDRKIVKIEKSLIINGIGVNVNTFPKKDIIDFNTFIMVARLLHTKGVIEYCEAAQIVKSKGYKYDFLLVGAEASITQKDIQKYIDNGDIKYLGLRKDINELLQKSTVFVLPSYAEGLPMSMLEAMSTGRPILVTNVTGCRETVIDGKNGFLVNVKDSQDLADKMIEIMSDKDSLQELGNYSRELVETVFNQEIINPIIVGEINKSVI